MTFDFSSLIWVFLFIMALQPLLTGRWYAVRRAQAIRAIKKSHGSRVIAMIHRQEKRSLFGFGVSRMIESEISRNPNPGDFHHLHSAFKVKNFKKV